jgi:hypothetical protein
VQVTCHFCFEMELRCIEDDLPCGARCYLIWAKHAWSRRRSESSSACCPLPPTDVKLSYRQPPMRGASRMAIQTRHAQRPANLSGRTKYGSFFFWFCDSSGAKQGTAPSMTRRHALTRTHIHIQPAKPFWSSAPVGYTVSN